MRRHGLRYHSLYSTWNGIIDRCTNKNSSSWKNYGGRGIRVCDRWLKIENFIDDLIEKPIGMSLDRIDNNGNYCPENVRWSTKTDQCNNMRKNVFIETPVGRMTLAQASKYLRVSSSTIKGRKRRGWTDKQIFETPFRKERVVDDATGRFKKVRK